MAGPIATYDFTIKWIEGHNHTDIKMALKDWCKKWAFQLEKSDDGYWHWQGRMSLIKKRRINEIAPLLHAEEALTNIHLSPTSKENANNTFYVMKKDTRMEGPWTDEDDEEVHVLTSQLKDFLTKEMYDWQKVTIELCKQKDFREIKLIYDTEGNAGKSILCEYLEYNGLAYEIPPFRLMEDLMQCVMGIKTHPCYVIDMPRAMKKDKLGEFYAGIECIKNGVAYDKRYAFKKKRFDRPQVIVFTNELPQFDLLSKDRWSVYELKDKKLTRMNLEMCF